MRYFAEDLILQGFVERYVKFDDPGIPLSLKGEVGWGLSEIRANRIIVTEPGEYRLLQVLKSWANKFGIAVEVSPDTRFLC